MRTYTYPHAIDNGAGERITFLRRAPGTNGDRVEVENEVLSGGPPISGSLIAGRLPAPAPPRGTA